MLKAPDWLWFVVPLGAIFAPLALLAYFIFRIYCLLVSQIEAHYELGLAWFFIVIEFITIIPTVFLYFSRVFVVRRPRRPRLFIDHDSLPRVDILITCAGEDKSTLVNVVKAACESDYPTELFRVIVLDDEPSVRLRYAIWQLSRYYPFLYYASRPDPEVPDYKAGNINFGIRLTADMSRECGERPAPFIAVLDADMIVEPDWLRTMIPHLLMDRHLALTCPPQHFYNLPTNDPLHQDLVYFYAMTEIIHDGLGAADCVGSGFIARRRALQDIGGFPTYSITEDTACSSELLGRGWRVAYIDQKLQVGEAPDTLAAHITQRTRWTMGNIQTAFNLRFRVRGRRVRRCTFRQRLAGFIFGASAFVNASLGFVGFVGLPLALMSGYPFVVYSSTFQLKWLIRLVSMWIFADYIHKIAMALFVGYIEAMRWDMLEQWMVPYFTLAFLRSFMLPKWLGGVSPSFKPTGSRKPAKDIPHERSPDSRLLQRLRTLFLHHHLYLHTIFIYACLLGLLFTFLRTFFPSLAISSAYGFIPAMDGKSKWIFLLVRVGWPPLFWIQGCASCCVPLRYVVAPPSLIDKNKVLRKDEMGVKRVDWEGWGAGRRKVFGRFGGMGEHVSTVVLGWTVACFWWSWFVE